ncbi:MAG: neuromedin U [Verrucomicrobiales bacterium]|nr:neuromedin U [Verrucomicrobiales bacterium]MCP5519845.1 neuromedin U [Verrucomicrobiales bacterium]
MNRATTSTLGPLIVAVLLSAFTTAEAIAATETETGEKPAKSAVGTDESLRAKTQNPVSDLISVPLQNNFDFGIGPKHATRWVLNIQPVVPFELTEDWNLITRLITPIISQESPAAGVPGVSGLGDLNPTCFLAPSRPSSWIWGAGPTFTLPTGTDSLLTSGKWAAGPAAVVLKMSEPWVFGLLANHQWDFAGWRGRPFNRTLIQPFINYNLPHGWYLNTAPIITADWENRSGDEWLVPVGGGVGKIHRLGRLPVNLQLGAYYNVVTPDNGPDWQLRFQLQVLLPK